jgi:hypothetical protein
MRQILNNIGTSARNTIAIDRTHLNMLEQIYNGDTQRVIGQLVWGLLREQGLSGFAELELLELRLSRRLGIPLDVIGESLIQLECDNLIWREGGSSDFLLSYESWFHTRLSSPTVGIAVEGEVNRLSLRCGGECFLRISELFNALAGFAAQGVQSFVGKKPSAEKPKKMN